LEGRTGEVKKTKIKRTAPKVEVLGSDFYPEFKRPPEGQRRGGGGPAKTRAGGEKVCGRGKKKLKGSPTRRRRKLRGKKSVKRSLGGEG